MLHIGFGRGRGGREATNQYIYRVRIRHTECSSSPTCDGMNGDRQAQHKTTRTAVYIHTRNQVQPFHVDRLKKLTACLLQTAPGVLCATRPRKHSFYVILRRLSLTDLTIYQPVAPVV